MISLSSNYPVLAEQPAEFKRIIDRHYATYDEWLSMKPFAGHAADRKIAADFISGKGPRISEECVSLVTSGHHACLLMIISAALQGAAIAVEQFSYPHFMRMARMMNVEVVGCKTDEKGMLPAALEAASEQHNIKAVYLMPTISNPTGTVMPLDRRMELIDIARRNGQIIVDDDAYGFLEDNPPPNFAQLAPDLGWYIYSLSKPFAPDIKVAFLVSPERYVTDIRSNIQLTTSNPSTFFTSLVSATIVHGELEKLLRHKRIEGKRRQTITRELLKGYTVEGHENGFHCWLKLPEGITSVELHAALQQEGVEVIPGASFTAPGTNNGEYIRIAMGAEKEMDKVATGIEIIKKLIS